MTSILDQFHSPAAGFAPKTLQDIFALRLAQKLGDTAAAAYYASLADEHPQARLLTAYRRTVRSTPGGDLGRRFHTEFERASDHGSDQRNANLLAIRVERRSIAVAVFYGDHLEYTQVRQLASTREKAIASAVGFLNSYRLDISASNSLFNSRI